jgi:hypothetical protein
MKKIIYWSIVFFLFVIPFVANVSMLIRGVINTTVLVSIFYNLAGLIVCWFLAKKFKLIGFKTKKIKNENKNIEFINKKPRDPNKGVF